MPPTPLDKLNLFGWLFQPVRVILQRILPDFPEAQVGEAATRASIVTATDVALVGSVPESRLVPGSWRRRIIGQALDAVLGPAAAAIGATPGAESDGEFPSMPTRPSLEGYYLTVDDLPGSTPEATARAAADAVLGADWSMERCEAEGVNRFFAINPGKEVTSGEAFSVVQRLKAQPGVFSASPDIIVWEDIEALQNFSVKAATVPGAPPPTAAFFPGIGLPGWNPELPGTENSQWSLELVRARAAWKVSDDAGKPSRGQGVRIASLDTGYTLHHEIAGPRLRTTLGFDFWDNDSDPRDTFTNRPGDQPGHGTGTISVVFSGDNSASGGEFVVGTAPSAELVPIRVFPSVLIRFGGYRRLSKAILFASSHDFHVLTLSMGALLPNGDLQSALREAVRGGMIVCCAAGNIYPPVVYPAAYPEAIAIAGCNIRRQPWRYSSNGPAVDVTGPAESVWHAEADRNNPDGATKVVRGSGTSFATPTVAGIAACWLAHHGRDHLISIYGRPNLGPLFHAVLMAHAATPTDGGTPGRFGVGIINAEHLLATPLPPPSSLATPATVLAPSAFAGGGLEMAMQTVGNIGQLMPEVPREQIRLGLASLMGVPAPQVESQLMEHGEELTFHLVANPRLLEQFRDSLPTAVGTAVPPATSLSASVSAAHERLRQALRAMGSKTLSTVIP